MYIDIETINQIAVQAGKVILEIYHKPDAGFETTLKADHSPLTTADRAAHKVIAHRLAEAYPLIPVISEEGRNVAYEERKDWPCYWCVDPLDGTKEFIRRNGEFTVNIALIRGNEPVLGVIYVPVQDVLYYASGESGSWKRAGDAEPIALAAKYLTAHWTAVGSRSHKSEEDDRVLARYPVISTISIGSSLKFCLIAEGKAQIYSRHGPTMEWDTAAGHAIAKYSGAKVTQPDGSPFVYNKPSLLNGSFLCVARDVQALAY